MRIVKVHEYYTGSGGEDTVFHVETDLLRSHDHEVIQYLEDNKRIASMNQVSVALQTIWSWTSCHKLKNFLQETKPDIVHFHNIFPLISPAAYYVCDELGLPVAQTLDNQRLVCPASTFYRDGKLCVDCLGKTPPWPGVLYACYHDSRLHTAIVASMLTFHRWIGTWQSKVGAFLCSTQFYRDLFVRAGFPADKLFVMPHFVQGTPLPSSPKEAGDYALFIGRLDTEKGVNTLLEAWRHLEFPLKIRGEGHLDESARMFVQKYSMDNVEFIGRMELSELSDLIGNARFLVMPSEGYYETFGMVIIEAYSRRVPVVASNIGVTTELVADQKTGVLFEAGNPLDLAEKARWMWNHSEEAKVMGENGLQAYQQRFAPEQCYKTLTGVYTKLISLKKGK